MNYLSIFLGYIVGMFVPYITSTGVILGINKNVDRNTKLDIFRTNALIEGTSIVMAYYGIRSSKSSISIEMDQFGDIDADLLWVLFVTILTVISVYLFAIQIYMCIPKGILYKAIGGLYSVSYIMLSTNLIITLLMICISLVSMCLLIKAPAISRSLSFLLTSLIR